MTLKILCLGDAITYGVRSTRGWPEHLWAQLCCEDPFKAVILNRGLPAPARMQDVLRAMDLSDIKPDITILAAPSYDAKGSTTPPNEYGALLWQAVAHAAYYSKGIVLCTPTPIYGHPGQPKGFARDARRWVAKATAQVATIESLQWERNKVILCNLSAMPEEMFSDGLNPKPEGYAWMASQILPMVRRSALCMAHTQL